MFSQRVSRVTEAMNEARISDTPIGISSVLEMQPQAFIYRLLRDLRHPSRTLQVLLAFALVYLLAIIYCRTNFYRDPTSLFFNPKLAYTPAYSAIRQDEAEAFIRGAALSPQTKVNISARPRLCVGIASVARKGARYLKSTIGSLMEGLDESERAAFHLMVFIAQTEPHLHPALSETWLANVADTILLYDLPAEELDRLRELEKDVIYLVQKAIFDYSYLLKACSKVNADYIAIIEDDVIALDGWYHRTLNALHIAESKTRQLGALNFLYLRLFYTEKFLGWNSEEWPYYVFWSLTVVGIQIICFVVLRRCVPNTKSWLTNNMAIAISGVCTPLSIIIFFAAGRTSMRPLPAGVNMMSNYGCCAQGLVFPSSRVPDLVDYYESRNMIGFSDVLTEELANRDNEIRWALTPSVLQHVGQKSTKGDMFEQGSDSHVSIAQSLWNFAFETNDASRLRNEHLLTLRNGRSFK